MDCFNTRDTASVPHAAKCPLRPFATIQSIVQHWEVPSPCSLHAFEAPLSGLSNISFPGLFCHPCNLSDTLSQRPFFKDCIFLVRYPRSWPKFVTCHPSPCGDSASAKTRSAIVVHDKQTRTATLHGTKQSYNYSLRQSGYYGGHNFNPLAQPASQKLSCYLEFRQKAGCGKLLARRFVRAPTPQLVIPCIPTSA
ncbi:hypothetical protein T440DRAFT_248135 [Plenodomus tracheiphilus IPT5]|uniref:Uncharacterized protein n=1 Tax=Plenodomus tracheiphilus IPT5 TaxID=1408161 RepID=A0A6A7AS23_9PLEO|nr:hypothetical protein T440DRAFT_248135 [Plenodomus tracheiphilus IPT5]